MGPSFRHIMEALAHEATGITATTRCLVLAPHPDDEVLGCGGTIARKVRRGASVSIAFLTDGRHGVAKPPAVARAVREAEAANAATTLGVGAERLVFLGVEDGRLSEHIEQVTGEVRRLVAALDVQELFVPYRWEFHADHQAAWQIGRASLPPGGRLYEYPIWYGPWLWDRLRWRSRLSVASHLIDMIRTVRVSVGEVAEIKRQALAAYGSQLAGFESRGEWGTRFLANFAGRYEVFFVSR